MSRSGYSDDGTEAEINLWRGAVSSAIRGRRGQALLRELGAALVALPEPKLCAHALADDDAGQVCALGAVALARELAGGKDRAAALLDLATAEDDELEPSEMAARFSIAYALAAEIVYVNDECGRGNETPEERHARVLAWVQRRIIAEGAP